MKIQILTPYAVNVSEKTNWFFLKIETDDGIKGWGEASLSGGWEDMQILCCKRLESMIAGKTIDEALPMLTVYPHSLGGLVWNSVLSAAEMALMDIKARAAGVPIHRLFGAPLRDTIRVYGNINRAATDRSPAGFAALARDRAAQGYTAFKLAPFDGVYWADLGDAEVKKKYRHALDCIFAVRDAVGPEAGVLIDCHWRFDEASALQLLRDLAPVKLFWAECLTSERAEHHPVLDRVRRAAEKMGVLVAGGERQVGLFGFEPLLRGKLLDVVMPDIKYTGGYTGMLAVAQRAHECGVRFSPHNPTGPVCNMGSLHACSLAPNFLILERQSEGGAVYDEIFTGDHPKLINGSYAVPQGPGLGITLNEDALRARPPGEAARRIYCRSTAGLSSGVWRYIRIGILLFILATVAQTAWFARGRTTEWKYGVRVAVYPIRGDDSAATAGYVDLLRQETYQPIAEFMKQEAERHRVALDTPIDVYLAPPLASPPPPAPHGGSTPSVMLWSLQIRYWAWRNDNFKGPRPDVRLFVNYFDPVRIARLPHSTGLQKGQIGVVNAFAHAQMDASNNVVITHELLHTLGASDKYDFANNRPRYPDGFADPQANPRYPQTRAEIMAGRIPVSETETQMPNSLRDTVIGATTAREINWVK